MATETGGEEEIAGINNPPLAAAASDSVAVATSKLLTESYYVLQCLEIKSGMKSLGSRLLEVAACLHSHVLK